MWKLPFFIANIKMHVKVKESVHRFEDIWGVQLMWQSSMQSWQKEACDSYNQSICFYLLFAPHSLILKIILLFVLFWKIVWMTWKKFNMRWSSQKCGNCHLRGKQVAGVSFEEKRNPYESSVLGATLRSWYPTKLGRRLWSHFLSVKDRCTS